MIFHVLLEKAEDGWMVAEVPALPGCATQGETFEELLANLHEAIEGCLSVEIKQAQSHPNDRVLEIAV